MWVDWWGGAWLGMVCAPMLLTLSTRSYLTALKGRHPKMTLYDLPTFANTELGLQGINIHTKGLKGWSINEIDKLRDQADKAGSPCLLLLEDIPHTLSGPEGGRSAEAIDRMEKVLRVANRLGCSGVTMSLDEKGAEDDYEDVVERLKGLVNRAERLEINLLLAPHKGLTETPQRLTELIRKVGGFRIGSFPDFEVAAGTGDADSYLRGLTPYASAVSISSGDFDARGKHKGFDFQGCLETITSVGYDGTVSLEYRGETDPTAALLASKAAIEAHVEAESA